MLRALQQAQEDDHLEGYKPALVKPGHRSPPAAEQVHRYQHRLLTSPPQGGQ